MICPYCPDFKKLKKRMIARGAKTKTTTIMMMGLKYAEISRASFRFSLFSAWVRGFFSDEDILRSNHKIAISSLSGDSYF
jgi:hypothetical protein